jgi:S1-C subfamily serine protease
MNPKLILAMLLMPACALAQESAPVSGQTHLQDRNLEAQLEAAQRKLDEAAREVAELSTQLGGPVVQNFSTAHGAFGRAIIGVQLDVTNGKDGARVLSVSPGGPAAEAGVRPGDVIVAVNGTDIKGDDATRQVVKIVRDVKPDSKVIVRVSRDGKTRDLTVTARPGPVVFGFEGRGFAEMPPMSAAQPFFMVRGPVSNMELATLTPQLGKYFGTEKGVLVVRAPPDGALKLEDGDVILAIDGREPTSGSHATRILSSYQPGEKVSLRIVRQHKNMDVETTVPDQPPYGPRKDVFFRESGPMAPAPPGMPGMPAAPGAPGKVIITHREDATT